MNAAQPHGGCFTLVRIASLKAHQCCCSSSERGGVREEREAGDVSAQTDAPCDVEVRTSDDVMLLPASQHADNDLTWRTEDHPTPHRSFSGRVVQIVWFHWNELNNEVMVGSV